MCAGGGERKYLNAPLTSDDPVVTLIRRINLVIHLEIGGRLESRLLSELHVLIFKGLVDYNHIKHIYDSPAPSTDRSLGKIVARDIVREILNGEKYVIRGAPAHKQFKKDVSDALAARSGQIHYMQSLNGVPLTILQLKTVYAFAADNSKLTKTVAHDLLSLLNRRLVSVPELYKDYRAMNEAFNQDMSAAEEVKARRKARRDNARNNIAGANSLFKSKTSLTPCKGVQHSKKQSQQGQLPEQ